MRSLRALAQAQVGVMLPGEAPSASEVLVTGDVADAYFNSKLEEGVRVLTEFQPGYVPASSARPRAAWSWPSKCRRTLDSSRLGERGIATIGRSCPRVAACSQKSRRASLSRTCRVVVFW